jgi:galactose mutarotase-like enzyme
LCKGENQVVAIDSSQLQPLSNQALILENAEIKLMIRPDLGGRIDQLQDLQTGKKWLWHPEGYDEDKSRLLEVGASFDENWTGGWDEVFPNDAAGEFQGHHLVDHGELWSQSWEVTESTKLGVTMRYVCQTVPVTVTKNIRISATKPKAAIVYTFQNQTDETIPFLLKHHAAIAIEPGDEIVLPDCLIEPVTLDFSRIIGQQQQTRFPKALTAEGTEINIKQVPPRSSQLQEFFYSSNLAAGHCGIRSMKSKSALIMRFHTAEFPYVWMFQSFGGWRNHYVVVVEPCTTMPYDLKVACENGTVAYLKPQETQTRSLMVTLQRSDRA